MPQVIKIVLIGFIIITVYSCNESITENKVKDMAPDTHLFLYPDSTISQQRSRLHVNWWGDDPDGLVVGFLFKWEGLDSVWNFTTKNDSVFSLPIGTVDTTYTFVIVAADNSGNLKYDKKIVRNGINFGPEPFIDENKNGKYDDGEFYYDIGNIDATPAEQKFPIKNSAPTIEWNDLSVLPAKSFPVMTVGWNANDLDGNESIVKIYLALNDTNDAVVLNGNVRLVTLKIDDKNTSNPLMNIFIGGNPDNVWSEKLHGLKLDDNNQLFVQAEDISGAKSGFVSLPSSGNWFVKKPKGKLLIVDDYQAGSNVEDFYRNSFNTLNGGILANNFDELNLAETVLPYQNITLLETLSLFDYIFWYSDDNPSLDVINSVTQSYLQSGGKIAFSMTFRDSSNSFDFNLSSIQSFIPVDSLGQKKSVSFLFPGALLKPEGQFSDFPTLKTGSTIGFVRTYFPNTLTSSSVYELQSSQVTGKIALLNNTKNLFFIGLPLHQCNANNNVDSLLEKIIFDKFNYK